MTILLEEFETIIPQVRPDHRRLGVVGFVWKTPDGLVLEKSSSHCPACLPGRRCDLHRERRRRYKMALRAHRRAFAARLRSKIEGETLERLATSEEVSRALAACLDRLGGPAGLAEEVNRLIRDGDTQVSLRGVEIVARLIEIQRDLVRSREIDLGGEVERERQEIARGRPARKKNPPSENAGGKKKRKRRRKAKKPNL